MLTLSEVAEEVARETGAPAPHISTISRWRTEGVLVGKSVVRLGGIKVGGRLYFERSAVREFLEAIQVKA